MTLVMLIFLSTPGFNSQQVVIYLLCAISVQILDTNQRDINPLIFSWTGELADFIP
jgi:hypothetical protein